MNHVLRTLTAIILVGTTAFGFAALLGCGQNAFRESAKRETDEALLFEARKQMNGSNWTQAITLIGQMSSTGQADRGTKAALASAYAGRCGLNLITLADRLANAGSTNIFTIFMTSFTGATASTITDCSQAETTLQSISTTPASRTADENVMLAFIGFSKIGAILSTYADTNHDGTADPGFNSCNVAHLPDAMLREIGTGITLAVAALAQSGGTIGSALGTSVTSACSTLAGINPAYDFCAITTTAGFSVNQVKALGGLVKTTDNPGIGTCAGDLATCVCP